MKNLESTTLEKHAENLIKLREAMVSAKLAFRIARDNIVNELTLAGESGIETELGNITIKDVTTERLDTKALKINDLAVYLKYLKTKKGVKVLFEGCGEDDE